MMLYSGYVLFSSGTYSCFKAVADLLFVYTLNLHGSVLKSTLATDSIHLECGGCPSREDSSPVHHHC